MNDLKVSDYLLGIAYIIIFWVILFLLFPGPTLDVLLGW